MPEIVFSKSPFEEPLRNSYIKNKLSKCNQCLKTFLVKDDLKKHLGIHHLFLCNIHYYCYVPQPFTILIGYIQSIQSASSLGHLLLVNFMIKQSPILLSFPLNIPPSNFHEFIHHGNLFIITTFMVNILVIFVLINFCKPCTYFVQT